MSRILIPNTLKVHRNFSTTTCNAAIHSCKVLVVGGGSGGCATAAKLSSSLKPSELIIVEPKNYHYYQPYFTLIGAGVGGLEDCRKPQSEVLPKNATWIKEKAVKFDPKSNSVTTQHGDEIHYELLLIAAGLQTNFDQIPGLVEGLSVPNTGVCSNYSENYVEKTFRELTNFTEGNAIFTFPNTPVKCPGAPQKICYLADDYFRKVDKRDKANLIYNTSLAVIFGVKRYADALWKVCKERDIQVGLRRNLVEIKVPEKQAVFENLDNANDKQTVSFGFLHVTPPMSTPNEIKQAKDLVNEAGFVDVDKNTLQHVKFPNVFAIGDCSSSPNSKTAAAAAAQCNIVFKNMTSFMKGQPLTASYDGYASCPLVTAYDKCILAEFDYNLTPLETFPFDQDKELYSMFLLKKNVMPPIYWNLMMNGWWNGPALVRNILHFNFK